MNIRNRYEETERENIEPDCCDHHLSAHRGGDIWQVCKNRNKWTNCILARTGLFMSTLKIDNNVEHWEFESFYSASRVKRNRDRKRPWQVGASYSVNFYSVPFLMFFLVYFIISNLSYFPPSITFQIFSFPSLPYFPLAFFLFLLCFDLLIF